MVRGSTKSDEGAAALCQIGQRDIGVALTRLCSCRAGVPVVWVAEARARPPDEVFVDTHRYDGSLHWPCCLESRRLISPSTFLLSLFFCQRVHQSLLHGRPLDLSFSLCANFNPFPLPSHPLSSLSFPPQSPVTAPQCTVFVLYYVCTVQSKKQ